MRNAENNYAFIDSQNVNLGIQALGWKLDFQKFRVYLKEKYGVKKAYLFIGYISKYQGLYQNLQRAGFVLKFKPAVRDRMGKIKGNIDADLVLHAMLTYKDCDSAIIVSGDGDFYSLVNHLMAANKLKRVICSSQKTCSSLLKKSAGNKLDFLESRRAILSENK